MWAVIESDTIKEILARPKSLTIGSVSSQEAVFISQSSGSGYTTAPSVTVTNTTRTVSSAITISTTLNKVLWIAS